MKWSQGEKEIVQTKRILKTEEGQGDRETKGIQPKGGVLAKQIIMTAKFINQLLYARCWVF